jgi:lipopolysaccharide transport system ATP-binding protein
MSSVAHQGRTVLFVSHNMAAVEVLCDSAILLSHGRVKFAGETAKVIDTYLQDGAFASYDIDLSQHRGREAGSTPVLQRLRMTDDAGTTLSTVQLGQPAIFELHLTSAQRLPEIAIAIHIYSSIGQRVVTFHSRYQHVPVMSVNDKAVICCRMDSCQLMPGTYSIVLSLDSAREQIDRIESGLGFEVSPRDIYGTGRLPPPRDGVFLPAAHWRIAS